MRDSIMTKRHQTTECLRPAHYAGASMFDLGTGGVGRP
jgi:hypothetical protein